MSLNWVRFERNGTSGFGQLDGAHIVVCSGDMFAAPSPTGERLPLADVRLLTPCLPTKMIGLWNNFAERALKEGLQRPAHPLYFLKANSCFAATGTAIRRPAGYTGQMVFEAELGIVIGRRCATVSVAEAPEFLFGYTTVNDITARDLMRTDPAFVHWTRAKSFDTFGVFGPCIATGLDPSKLRVRALLDGQAVQDYPVSDMFFSPFEIVSHLSHDMTLEPGDVIACGTSVGAGPMPDGALIEIVIDGIGRLRNQLA
jgi:2-keto-4-pentenoate hydratase/2-oxohepta-3-ene-1,7-dioic acid hydratase in catechol pathway